MKDLIILAIESSCDETACAIVKNGNQIISNVVSTQIDVHEKYGGVVPEVASRIHVENISIVICEALEKSNMSMDDVDAIAYTKGPGLIGSLHVGVQAAKTIAWLYNKPLLPIHHLIGHIYANGFVDDINFPLLSLVVSGGHTELVYMKDNYSFEILGCTQDDAIGEAYDKVARVLGLGYPGGPKIDKLAKIGRHQYTLPTPKTDNPLNFSFSGLKSGVLQCVAREEKIGNTIDINNLAYDFQEVALSTILAKTKIAIENKNPLQLVLAGGVAANSRLRELIIKLGESYPNLKITLPPLWCCTDNAAMIGAAGYYAYINNRFGDLTDSATPSMDLENS